jgi:asparagine synthase (glutamine-hydrolysing)
MCGIAGYITRKKYYNFSFVQASKKLKILMKNRGPDQQGSFQYNNEHVSLNLFSSRLSIIDLDKRSNQPFKTKDFVLIFNGEIYNYIEIKKFLLEKKFKFKTESDTEVLIKAYEYWGESCVDHFDGMWSFCIFDYKKNRVFLSRDNFGEKPLYYHFDGKNLVFGSEIKYLNEILKNNLNKEINDNKIYDYIVKGYKSLHKNYDTFYKGIQELKQGHNLLLKLKSFELKEKKYLNFGNLTSKIVSKDPRENIENIKQLLIESLKLRLRSDVPLAFCLSGGVDSASLVSLCYKKFNLKAKCYSIIDPDKRYNELKNITVLKNEFNCDIDFIKLKKEKTENFLSNLKNLINYHDAPISTISYYIHSKISKKASESNHKVIFSGTGADEIFTGYYDHFLLYLNSLKNKDKKKKESQSWKKYIKPFVRNKFLKDSNLFKKRPDFRDHIFHSPEFIKKFLNKFKYQKFNEINYNSDQLKNRMLNELFHESVPVILKEDDLNSMYNSIENRSPFLSKKLIRYSLSMPTNQFINNSYSKYPLRCAMKNILNDKIRLNRKKMGFNSNLRSITNFDQNILYEFLNQNEYLKNLINLNQIKKINFKKELTNSTSKFLFSIICLKIFLEKN